MFTSLDGDDTPSSNYLTGAVCIAILSRIELEAPPLLSRPFVAIFFASNSLVWSSLLTTSKTSCYGRIVSATFLTIAVIVLDRDSGDVRNYEKRLSVAFLAWTSALTARAAVLHCKDQIDLFVHQDTRCTDDPVWDAVGVAVVCDSTMAGLSAFAASLSAATAQCTLLLPDSAIDDDVLSLLFAFVAAVQFVTGSYAFLSGPDAWEFVPSFQEDTRVSVLDDTVRRIAQVQRPAAVLFFNSYFATYVSAQYGSEEGVKLVCVGAAIGVALLLWLSVYLSELAHASAIAERPILIGLSSVSAALLSQVLSRETSNAVSALAATAGGGVLLAAGMRFAKELDKGFALPELWIIVGGVCTFAMVLSVGTRACGSPSCSVGRVTQCLPSPGDGSRLVVRLLCTACSVSVLIDLIDGWDAASCNDDVVSVCETSPSWTLSMFGSPQLCFLTTWCLLISIGAFCLGTIGWCVRLCTGSKTAFGCALPMVDSLSLSTSTLLLFAASALLPADCGSTRGVPVAELTAELVRFYNKHLVQAAPSLAWALCVPHNERVSGSFTTAIGWTAGGVLPMAFWFSHQLLRCHAMPHEYGCVNLHSVVCMLLCGFVPWLASIRLHMHRTVDGE